MQFTCKVKSLSAAPRHSNAATLFLVVHHFGTGRPAASAKHKEINTEEEEEKKALAPFVLLLSRGFKGALRGGIKRRSCLSVFTLCVE